MQTHFKGWLALLLAAGLPLAAVADEAPATGVWQKHEYTFSFAGFTSNYSCDGIADKVKLLLLAAGARPDAKVSGSCSDPLGAPSRISIARATFHVLVPEPAAGAGQPGGAAPEAGAERVPGVWKAVELRDGTPNWLDHGDCELVEQFDHELLPLFTTRNHQSHMTCVAHQYTLSGISVRFESFTALPAPRAGHAAKPR